MLLRRMRAHGNYAENMPIFLVLLGFLELATGGSLWLWGAAIALHPRPHRACFRDGPAGREPAARRRHRDQLARPARPRRLRDPASPIRPRRSQARRPPPGGPFGGGRNALRRRERFTKVRTEPWKLARRPSTRRAVAIDSTKRKSRHGAYDRSPACRKMQRQTGRARPAHGRFRPIADVRDRVIARPT